MIEFGVGEVWNGVFGVDVYEIVHVTVVVLVVGHGVTWKIVMSDVVARRLYWRMMLITNKQC